MEAVSHLGEPIINGVNDAEDRGSSNPISSSRKSTTSDLTSNSIPSCRTLAPMMHNYARVTHSTLLEPHGAIQTPSLNINCTMILKCFVFVLFSCLFCFFLFLFCTLP